MFLYGFFPEDNPNDTVVLPFAVDGGSTELRAWQAQALGHIAGAVSPQAIHRACDCQVYSDRLLVIKGRRRPRPSRKSTRNLRLLMFIGRL